MSLITSGGPCLPRNSGVHYNYMPLKNDSSCKKLLIAQHFGSGVGCPKCTSPFGTCLCLCPPFSSEHNDSEYFTMLCNVDFQNSC